MKSNGKLVRHPRIICVLKYCLLAAERSSAVGCTSLRPLPALLSVSLELILLGIFLEFSARATVSGPVGPPRFRCSAQVLEDDRQKAEATLERSKSVLEGERAEVQRARDDLDRFSARVSRCGREQERELDVHRLLLLLGGRRDR